MVKFAWTNIVRHVPVAGGASSDDPDLTDYWAKRRRKIKPALDTFNLRLLTEQDGCCPLCGDHLLTADQLALLARAGAVTGRDPGGREVVSAPFVVGLTEPGENTASAHHADPQRIHRSDRPDASAAIAAATEQTAAEMAPNAPT